MKPAAGIVGLIASPLQGAWKSARPDVTAVLDVSQRGTRIAQGVEAVQKSTQAERSEIIRKFEEAIKSTQERRETIAKLAEQAILEESAPPMPRSEEPMGLAEGSSSAGFR